MLKSINFLEQTVSSTLDFEDTVSEDLQGNNKHIFGNWRKGFPSYIVMERFATLSPAVM